MLLLCYIGFLMYSNSLCLQRWDEARCALHALAMSKNNNFIVTYYQDAPDMWYTKPPLLIWIQALLFKLFTPSVLVFRLPTLAAAIALCFFIYWYFIKYRSNYFIGVIATVILISCDGIARIHGTRTGEYETLLILFTTTYLFAYFQFLETKENKWLASFFVLLICATLTKSIQALLFLPALFFYTIFTKNLKSILVNKIFYIGFLSFLFIVVGYYLLREHYNPGFLNTVWNNELGGRFTTVIENHKHPFTYYFGFMYNRLLGFWFAIFMLSIPIIISLADVFYKKLCIYLLSCSLCYMLVISSAQTKLGWYDIPIYPLITVVIAIALSTIFDNQLKKTFSTTQKQMLIIFGIVFFLIPITIQMQKVYKLIKAQENDLEMCTTFFLHNNLKKKKLNLDNCYVQGDLDCSYSGQIEFYQELYKNQHQNLHLFFWNLDTIVAPCKLISRYDQTKYFAEQHFEYKIIKEVDQLKFYELYRRKD